MHIKSSKEKRAKRRREEKIIHMVRMHNVARDGYCRMANDVSMGIGADRFYGCAGPSELAHLENLRRFKTRGMRPELRHTTAGTVMLCRRHHQQYDAHTLRVELLSSAGADGELKWR